MPRSCKVCGHAQRQAVDLALIGGGQSYRDIAKQFALTRSGIQRHAKEHLPAALARAHQVIEAARADDLLSEVRYLQARTMGIMDRAEAVGSLAIALRAVGEARALVELLARLLATMQASEVEQQGFQNAAQLLGSLGYRQLADWVDRVLTPQQRVTFAELLDPEFYAAHPEFASNWTVEDKLEVEQLELATGRNGRTTAPVLPPVSMDIDNIDFEDDYA